MASYSISEVNRMDKSDFVQLFGSVFEETPEIAEQAWAAMPFDDVGDLHRKMVRLVEEEMTTGEKLALIQAHPELGATRKMAVASVQEQAGVGLDQMNEEVREQIFKLNASYREKFGFPFVMAVKGQTLERIKAALESRLAQQKEDEIGRSLFEIYKIARFRLDDLIETH